MGDVSRRDFDPPIKLNTAQLVEMEGGSEITGAQFIYATSGDWVLVGNNPDSEGDGAWLDEKGIERHS